MIPVPGFGVPVRGAASRAARAALGALLLATLPAGAARAATIEVPIAYEAKSIGVEVRIDGGRTLRMLLDTGWHSVTLDTRVARELGWIAPGRDARVAGERRLRELRIGDLVERDGRVDVADLSGLNPPGLAPYDGVLGCSFFRGRIVQIDYPKRVLRFLAAPPAAAADPAARTELPIHFSTLGCLPISDSVWVNGRRVSGMFDTGAALPFLVTPRAAEYLGLADSIAGLPTARSGFYAGDSARSGVARVGMLRRVRLGALVAGPARAIFASPGEGLTDQPLDVWGVLIGNAFLENFVVTLDDRGRRITLDRPR